MKITPLYRDVSAALSAHQIIKHELPFVNALYNHQGELHEDISQWLSFFIDNRAHLPMYGIETSAADAMSEQLTEYYAMLLCALDQLFKEGAREIRRWFDCSASRKASFPVFLDFAKAVYSRDKADGFKASSVYGRFDAAADPESGRITGVYEFNGDTPVMLFESINLQNLIAQALGEGENQQNEWWDASLAQLAPLKGKTVAVACDVSYIEDSSTCETIVQMFDAVGANAYLTTLEGLNHDVLSLDKPFTIDGVASPVDAVFMLLPWEEMLVSGSDILLHWQSWIDNVRFFEPAWRWFVSHKGMLAWVTHLMSNDERFAAAWSHMPHLPAYLSAEPFWGKDFVSKPVVGRLSQNITIHKTGYPFMPTEGQYADEPMVYQAYLKPGQVGGRNNFIMGGWVSGKQVSTLCIREFDGAVLDLQNERFVAHLLIDDEA